MSESNDALRDLRQKKEAVLKIRSLNEELRTAILAEQSKQGQNSSDTCKMYGLNLKPLKDFLSGSSVIMGHKILGSLTAYAKRPELAKAITELCVVLKNRPGTIGLAALDLKDIQMVFDLQEAHQSDGQAMTLEQYANIFSPHDKSVLSILHGMNREAISKLSQNLTYDGLQEFLLSDDYRERLQQKKAEIEQARLELQAKIVAAIKQAQNKYKTVSELSKAMGMSISMIYDSMACRACLATMQSVLKRLVKLEQEGPVNTVSKPSAEKPAKPEKQPTEKLDGLALPSGITAERKQLLHEYESTKQSLLAKYGSPQAAAEAAKLEESALSFARFKRFHDASLRNYLEHMKKTLGTNGQSTEQPAITPDVAAVGRIAEVQITEEQRAATLLDQPLTFETIRSLDWNPGQRGIDFATKQIRLVIALLNSFAQIEDDAVRQVVRLTLSQEVENLDHTIRMFSLAYPNRVLQRYADDQKVQAAFGLISGRKGS